VSSSVSSVASDSPPASDSSPLGASSPAGTSAAVAAVMPPIRVGEWRGYPTGPAVLGAVAAGRAPPAVRWAPPGPARPGLLAAAVGGTLESGRGALVVVPAHRDVDRLPAAFDDALDADAFVALRADLGPAERYRRFLAVRRGQVRAVVGTRAAVFAPVADL